MPGIQVDGNDVLAVHAAATEMLERARSGAGPGLIEAVTYRMGDHTTADEASRYRSAEETEYWRQRDPIARLGLLLRARDLWSDRAEQEWQAEVKRRVDRDVAELEAMPAQPPEAIFENMYAKLTPALAEQRRALLAEVTP